MPRATITLITRQQMIDKLEADAGSYDRVVAAVRKGSFAFFGAISRSSVAHNLAQRLRNGHTPSTREVVGRFGAGARYDGGKNEKSENEKVEQLS